MGLKVNLLAGESVRLDGGRITVTLLEKKGSQARLDIAADQSVTIEPPQKAAASEYVKRGLNLRTA